MFGCCVSAPDANIHCWQCHVPIGASIESSALGRGHYFHLAYQYNLCQDNYPASCLYPPLLSTRDTESSCILHVGKSLTLSPEKALDNLVGKLNTLDKMRYLTPYNLLLENAAGQGTEVGRNWEELRYIFEKVDNAKIGLCIDTQHAFASGLCSFIDHEVTINCLEEASQIAPVKLIHLNDSAKPYASHVDRHAPLGTGYIWAKNKLSLVSLITYCRDAQIDIICEPGNSSDIALITSLRQY